MNPTVAPVLLPAPERLTRTVCQTRGLLYALSALQRRHPDELHGEEPTDNSKIASYMAKDVLVMKHGKKILEDGDRKKSQTGAEKIAGSGDV